MFAYAIIPLTCWACALLAAPRRPAFGNEVEELVYSRLLGRTARGSRTSVPRSVQHGSVAAPVARIGNATTLTPGREMESGR